MTEHDDPTDEDPTTVDPTSEHSADDDAAWFRAHLDPVVGGDIPEAWDEIRSQATGQQRMLIPLPTAAAKAWPGRRLVAVAALLLVTVGLVGLGLKLVGSDDDERPAGGDDGATGFYVPGQLPPGWELTELGIASDLAGRTALRCPCDVTKVSQDDADGGYIAFTSADLPSSLGGTDPTIGHQTVRSGSYVKDGDVGTVVWRTATGSRAVTSSSMDRVELETLAESWTGDKPPVIEGHHVSDHWSRDRPIDRVDGIGWTFASAETGQSLHVLMRPEVLPSGLSIMSTVALPGNGLPLAISPDGNRIVAAWPGNTELFAMSVGSEPFPDQATIEAIFGSFRPADAAAWSEYLGSPPIDKISLKADPHDFDVLRTDRIDDWLVVDATPGPSLPARPVEVIQGNPDDPSAAITVESDIDQIDVAADESFTIELIMTNRTGATVEVSGCPFGGVTWSLVDEHGLVTPAGGIAVDCASNPDRWPDGEQRTQTFEFPGWGQMPDEGPIAAVIQFGDTTGPGATVVVAGQVGG